MSKSVYVRVVYDLELLRYVFRCAIDGSFNLPQGLIKYIVIVVIIITPHISSESVIRMDISVCHFSFPYQTVRVHSWIPPHISSESVIRMDISIIMPF